MSVEAIQANPEVHTVQSYRVYGEGAAQFASIAHEIDRLVSGLRDNSLKARSAERVEVDSDTLSVFSKTQQSLERQLQTKIALAASIDGVHFVGFQSAASTNPVVENKDNGPIPTQTEISSLKGKSGERHHGNGFGNMNLSSVGETLRFVAPVVSATTLALVMGAVSVEVASAQNQKEVTKDLCDVDSLQVNVITPCAGTGTTHTPTNVRLKPSTTETAPYFSTVVKKLNAQEVVTIDGMTRGESNSIWYAVTLPDGTKGFISYSLFNPEDITAAIVAEAAPGAPTQKPDQATKPADGSTDGVFNYDDTDYVTPTASKDVYLLTPAAIEIINSMPISSAKENATSGFILAEDLLTQYPDNKYIDPKQFPQVMDPIRFGINPERMVVTYAYVGGTSFSPAGGIENVEVNGHTYRVAYLNLITKTPEGMIMEKVYVQQVNAKKVNANGLAITLHLASKGSYGDVGTDDESVQAFIDSLNTGKLENVFSFVMMNATPDYPSVRQSVMWLADLAASGRKVSGMTSVIR